MPEEKKEALTWRKKLELNRMSFESILFEKELVSPEKEKLYIGLLGAAGIALVSSALLAFWVLRHKYFIGGPDAAAFATVRAFLDHYNAGGIWSLLKPFSLGAAHPASLPFYYLLYVPVLRYMTSDIYLALVLVHSFFLAILVLSVFMAVKKSRNNFSGWVGAAIAASMPFVIGAARHPGPVLATIALAAALYCCYINSNDFDHPDWNVWFGLSLSLGFYTDKMFWLYLLPLLPFLVTAVTGGLAMNSLMKGLLPGMVFNLPWYVYLAAFGALGHYAGPAAEHIWRPGVMNYLGTVADSVGLPMFLLGGAALLWMYYSLFMPYTPRKIVAAWFWAPFLICYIWFSSRPELVYPALLPFALAVAVMTPNIARKYIIGLAAALLLLNHSGLAPVFVWRTPVIFGLPKPPEKGAFRIEEALTAIRGRVTGFRSPDVLLVGEDKDLNYTSLGYLAAQTSLRKTEGGKSDLNLVHYPAGMLGLADFVVHRTGAFGVPRNGPDTRDFEKEIGSPWFAKAFTRLGEFDLQDTSKLIVFEKTKPEEMPFDEGSHKLKNCRIGGFNIAAGTLELFGYDAARGVYSMAAFTAPEATFGDGLLVYSLQLEIPDFLPYSDTGDLSDLRPLKMGKVKITKLKTGFRTFEKYLSAGCAMAQNLKIEFEGVAQPAGEYEEADDTSPEEDSAFKGILKFNGDYNGDGFAWIADLNGRPPVIDIRNTGVTPVWSWAHWDVALDAYPPVVDMKNKGLFNGLLSVPWFFHKFFSYSYDISQWPYNITFEKTRRKKQMLEIYSKSSLVVVAAHPERASKAETQVFY